MAYVSLTSGGTVVNVYGSNGQGSYPRHVSLYKRTDNSTWTQTVNTGGMSSPQVLIANPISITGLTEGLYSVNYWYWNGSGWIQELTDARFTVDLTAPTVFSTAVNRTRGGGVTLTMEALDYSLYPDINFTNTTGTGIALLDWDLRKGSDWATGTPIQSSANLGQAQATNPKTFTSNYSAGTYHIKVQAFDRNSGLLSALATSGTYNTNTQIRYDSFVVDPVPSSGPYGYLYTPSGNAANHTLTVAIDRTDSTCDLSRWEMVIGGTQIAYIETSTNNYYYFLSNNFTGTNRNRPVTVKTYQINWTGTSPSTNVVTHSGMSPYRSHNMNKRNYASIEKRSSWLNGVTP